VVPVCYAFDGKCIYSALDLKPKRVQGRALKRVRNILQNPLVSLVIDDYSEDWNELAYVLVQGRADLVEDADEQQAAEAMLRAKYGQYEKLLEKGCAIIRVTPNSVVSWRQIS
jgi:PPOX class probable F420-dependent enzyme